MYLRTLLDLDLLVKMRDEGFVKVQYHLTEPLVILNYTDKTTYDRMWNDVTRTCRGLIYHMDTQEIVARPFPKFFNYGEHDEGTLDLDANALVTDKLDGSLGILYQEPVSGLWSIATRGSFASDQAVHATELFRREYLNSWRFLEGYTELFEVVFPQNRIVLDYGSEDDLFHLGSVHIETGRSYPPSLGSQPTPAAAFMGAYSLRAALELEPRPNAEGVVVHFIDEDKRVKIKQEDYVKLHRIITGMNARTVWEALGEGKTAEDLCEGVPEEFWPWIREVSHELLTARDTRLADSKEEYARILVNTGGAASRKEFAVCAQQSPYRPWLFLILDGRDPLPAIWKTLKPSADRALVHRSEDTA